MANSSQLIFLKGKEIALRTLFVENSSEEVNSFGYLAMGYDPEEKGFTDEENSASNGFIEIDGTSQTSYKRIPLKFEKSKFDYDTGKVLATFSATLESSNINGHNINQFAVVNTSQANDPQTVIYSASTFPVFNKTEGSSITFMPSFRM